MSVIECNTNIPTSLLPREHLHFCAKSNDCSDKKLHSFMHALTMRLHYFIEIEMPLYCL